MFLQEEVVYSEWRHLRSHAEEESFTRPPLQPSKGHSRQERIELSACMLYDVPGPSSGWNGNTIPGYHSLVKLKIGSNNKTSKYIMVCMCIHLRWTTAISYLHLCSSNRFTFSVPHCSTIPVPTSFSPHS